MKPKCHLCGVEIDKKPSDDWYFTYRKSKKTGKIYWKIYFCDRICLLDTYMKPFVEVDGFFVQDSTGQEHKLDRLMAEIIKKLR